MTRPSPQELLAETARLAFHFHWPLDTLLDLEHRDRRAFLAQADGLAAAYARGGVPPARVVEPGAEVAGASGGAGPGADVAAAEPEPVVDLDAIQDERVRKLFQTYFPAAS